MRAMIVMAAVAAFMTTASAQQGRPPGQAPKPPGPSAQPRAPAPPAPPPIFPCRTAEEICFLGVVMGKNQVAVLFTNAEKAEGIDAKPIDVLTGDASAPAPLDLAPHTGRVVMLTGAYDAQAGLTKAELVEVGSPLLSLVVKAQLGGEEEPPPGRPQPPQKPRR